MFGTRLHGAIAGLLAGTPAVLVTHDARTAEMARQASIPSVSAETVTEDADFQQVYDACDIETFNRNAPAYYRRFAKFFDASGRHRIDARRDPVVSGCVGRVGGDVACELCGRRGSHQASWPAPTAAASR